MRRTDFCSYMYFLDKITVHKWFYYVRPIWCFTISVSVLWFFFFCGESCSVDLSELEA